MRSVNATLLTNQKSLGGSPCRQVIIGSGTTVDVSSYVLAYEYEEFDREGGLTVVLDNKASTFNSLTGDYAPITQGAPVELKRGVTVSGTDYTEELPTTWIETIVYDYAGGQSVCILECVDWIGKLARWRASSEQSWSSISITTILEWILTQVSLTREAGAMTALSLDFDIKLREVGAASLRRLARKIPEYLHPGLDGEIKWREIDGAEASGYTFGWNAEHPLLTVEAGDSAWAVNSVTVKGTSSTTGTADDATEIAAVGTRKLTLYDSSLASNANCAQRAQAELDFYEAGAVEAILICRPCHGLELWDVVKVDDPPWGGADVTGRVIRYVERWNHLGDWYQRIYLGAAPEKETSPSKTKSKGSSKRRSSRSSYRGIKRRLRLLEDWVEWLMETVFGGSDQPAVVPVGGIIMWSGAVVDIPAGWALCDGTGDTPDLRARFVVGAGGTYAVNDTGGEDTSDLAHTHGPGNLVTDGDAHTHGPGNLVTDGDSHAHTFSTVTTGNETASIQVQSGTGAYAARGSASLHHAHTITTLGSHIGNDDHNHSVTGGVTASDDHNHSVTGGLTASSGAAAQENRPPYLALAYIMRVE